MDMETPVLVSVRAGTTTTPVAKTVVPAALA
jgi:hypothetical protein